MFIIYKSVVVLSKKRFKNPRKLFIRTKLKFQKFIRQNPLQFERVKTYLIVKNNAIANKLLKILIKRREKGRKKERTNEQINE